MKHIIMAGPKTSNTLDKIEISIKDNLNHHIYNWPKTLVRYPLEFEKGKARMDSFLLTDGNGGGVPMQLADVKEEDGFVISAVLCFITDLPTGADYRYCLYYDSEASDTLRNSVIKENFREDSDEEFLTIDNGLLKMRIAKTRTMFDTGEAPLVFEIGTLEENMMATAELCTSRNIKTLSSRCIAYGPIFHEQVLEYLFDDGSSYCLTLRLIQGMEFVEMEERISGLEDEGMAFIDVRWKDFRHGMRYALNRGREKIDMYVDEEGRLPFIIVPFTNWVNWWRTRAAAFMKQESKTTVGIFVRDAIKWNDGKYNLWGDSKKLAVSFYYRRQEQNGELIWRYPLVQGSRSTAIALYDSQKEQTAWSKEIGGDFGRDYTKTLESYINELWLWYAFFNLDKVKDWVLDWDEAQDEYPRYFDGDKLPSDKISLWYFIKFEVPQPSDMGEIIERLSGQFNHPFCTSPVQSREFASWVPVFDITAAKMTSEQFKKYKAACALMAYARMEEDIMPINNMLSGHPNFLADMKMVPGMMAGLFPHHPHARKWLEHFEKAMALNLKYHTRPDVKAWESRGGRWTENLGTYAWAMLRPTVRTALLLHKTTGADPLLYPNIAKLAYWLLNCLSAPVDGQRTYPPQGAHSGAEFDPMPAYLELRMLGQLLMRYEPLLGEQMLSVSRPYMPAKEEKVELGKDIWRQALNGPYRDNIGTPPVLKSEKFTGYGYILRAAVGTPGEMSVYLQQIDEGPNYRWGRAGDGGNGVIYYYAAGERYSYNRPEDVGDDNMGDAQACCNFGVLIDKDFRGVGRNDLTEPMYDFGFAQFAKVNASDRYSRPFYRSRSVLMSGNDYIVIYDEVGDMRVYGRFSWFVKENEKMPYISQLKPGVEGVDVGPGEPLDGLHGVDNHQKPKHYSKGRYYQGFGDFLTVVSHKGMNGEEPLNARETEYGAEVTLNGRTDMIFRDGAEIDYNKDGVSFCGYAGIIRLYGNGKIEAAMFEGSRIGVGSIEFSMSGDSPEGNTHAGIAFTLENNKFHGKWFSRGIRKVKISLDNGRNTNKHMLFVDSMPYKYSIEGNIMYCIMPAGRHTWEWTDRQPAPTPTEITAVEASSGEAHIYWITAEGAEGYDVAVSEDNCETWRMAAENIREKSLLLKELQNNTKIHVRVRPVNKDTSGEWSSPYPVYITDKTPESPEGLRIWRGKEGYRITWGAVLGVIKYRLYKRETDDEEFECIYEGNAREYMDKTVISRKVYEYQVSALNGNGESAMSNIRSTEVGGMIDWDPRPDEMFRRDSRSHEFGYRGFDHWENDEKGILKYPE